MGVDRLHPGLSPSLSTISAKSTIYDAKFVLLVFGCVLIYLIGRCRQLLQV